ncbi:hypothetical protein GW17_00000368 [Ensete ventricosum]|nr:hypothetical protein GW17_00000368 [Ensete ventricosum]RZR78872.1 hypothetical protein BHM03_00004422 [Ensete ventricosum]
MAGGCIIVEATTSSNTELLLPGRASYARSLSCVGDKLRSFRSYLRWMCVDQFDVRHVMVSWSLESPEPATFELSTTISSIFVQAAKEFETELKKDPEDSSNPPPVESPKAVSSEDEKKELETSGTNDST